MSMGAISAWLFYGCLCALAATRIHYKRKHRAFGGAIDALRLEPLPLLVFRWSATAAQAAALVLPAVWPEWNAATRLPIEALPPEAEIPLRLAGFAGSCLSLILLVRTHQALGASFTVTIGTERAERLVTEGPYRRIRHPMYVSYFLLFASLAPLSGNWAFSAFGELVILSLAIWRRPAEEAALRARFPGEYDAWVNATGAFIPKPAAFADDQEE